MAGKKLTISLTAEQQKQIKSATGKSIKELNIDVASARNLSVKDLEAISGGGKVGVDFPMTKRAND